MCKQANRISVKTLKSLIQKNGHLLNHHYIQRRHIHYIRQISSPVLFASSGLWRIMWRSCGTCLYKFTSPATGLPCILQHFQSFPCKQQLFSLHCRVKQCFFLNHKGNTFTFLGEALSCKWGLNS